MQAMHTMGNGRTLSGRKSGHPDFGSPPLSKLETKAIRFILLILDQLEEYQIDAS